MRMKIRLAPWYTGMVAVTVAIATLIAVGCEKSIVRREGPLPLIEGTSLTALFLAGSYLPAAKSLCGDEQLAIELPLIVAGTNAMPNRFIVADDCEQDGGWVDDRGDVGLTSSSNVIIDAVDVIYNGEGEVVDYDESTGYVTAFVISNTVFELQL